MGCSKNFEFNPNPYNPCLNDILLSGFYDVEGSFFVNVVNQKKLKNK